MLAVARNAAVVDEAYARTIRVPHFGGQDELQTNGAQHDLHGYRRVRALAET